MAAYYQPPYAQPAYRMAAWLLDSLIFLVISLIPVILLYGSGLRAELIGIEMGLQAVYYILPTALFGKTPAKHILGMRVTMDDGSPLQPDVAILRYLGLLLTTLVPLGILVSWVVMMTDAQRRSVHDRLARTIVTGR